MTTLNVTVKQTTTKGETGFTGTVAIPGLKATRLARKDGTTLFPTTSALKTVARGLGRRLGFEVEYDETWKKAAKKSVGKTSCCKGNSTCCK
jgi:hypothetical protein